MTPALAANHLEYEQGRDGLEGSWDPQGGLGVFSRQHRGLSDTSSSPEHRAYVVGPHLPNISKLSDITRSRKTPGS